ncbi:MAG: TVP38/TMEM64 family protein [Microcoleaceae cyanobacterium]
MNNQGRSPVKTQSFYKHLKLVALGLGVVGLIIGGKVFGVQQLLTNALDWVANLGAWGPLVFILIYIVATVLFLPGSLLTLGAGVLFGVVPGSIYVSIGSVIGATCAFLVGRYLARGWVSKQISENEKFKAIDEAVGREGWKIVGLTRLSPIFPFNLLNYSFGLTNVSLRDYFFASWIGMIPGTIMYVYLGSLAGELATLGTEGRSRTMAEWILYGVGLLATVAVTVYVTKIAKQALNQKISEEQSEI